MSSGSAADFAELVALHEQPTFDDVERVLEFAVKAVQCTYAGVMFVHRKRGVEHRCHPSGDHRAGSGAGRARRGPEHRSGAEPVQ